MLLHRLSGLLTEADHKSHVPVRFAVPEGATRLEIALTAAPDRARGALFDNLISLSLFGPSGCRGARHNNPDRTIRLTAQAATPGFCPGPIEPGEWTLWLDVFRLIGPDPVAWSASVTVGFAPEDGADAPGPALPARRGPGLFKGDLHAHTDHSDASWGVADLVAWGRRHGLDFLTVSDHNTVSAVAEARRHAAAALTVLPGMELTTHHGHALALGLPGWREWRPGAPSGRAMADLAAGLIAEGLAFVIAHPEAPGDPACTGCRWEFADMRPGPARIVEVWNGGVWSDYNEAGLALYRRWLDAGHRLVCTAGTDIHGPADDRPALGFNHVEAASNDPADLLAAIAAGRNTLSDGPRLSLWIAGAGGETVRTGETCRGDGTLRLALDAPEGPLAWQLVGSGGVLRSGRLEGGDPLELAVPLDAALRDAAGGWIMAEARGSTGALRALSNPLFLA